MVEPRQYSAKAVEFIHHGLDYTVKHIHGPEVPEAAQCRHVSGQQLCDGLRELALARWGRMARTVLHCCNVCDTMDFGQIVFSLIDVGMMQKVEGDTIEDFRNVYDFQTVFETDYRFPSQP